MSQQEAILEAWTGNPWIFQAIKRVKKDFYHFEQQNRSREVGVLFEVSDDCSLNDLTTTLHYQTW